MYDNLTRDGKKADSYFCSGYLDSPVLITPRSQYLVAYQKLMTRGLFSEGIRFLTGPELKTLTLSEKKVYNLHTPDCSLEQFDIIDPDEYPSLLHSRFPDTRYHNYDEASKIATAIYTGSLRALSQWIKPTGRSESPKLGFSSDIGPDERYYYDRWSFWDHIVAQVQEMYRAKKHFGVRINTKAGYIITNTEIVRIKLHNSAGTLYRRTMTWDQLLMIKDSLYSRAQALTAARVIYPDLPSLPRRVRELYGWHELCLTRHSNLGFNILKQSEALSKAFLSTVAGDEFGSDGPFLRMIDKIKDKERDMNPNLEGGSLADKFHQILQRCTCTTEVVELFGLHRVSCHPLIDPQAGGRSAAEQARSPDLTTPKDAEDINNNFKRMFLESYLRIKKKWPRLQFDGGKDTRLYELYSRQTLGLHRNSYPLSDWRFCRFQKLFDLDTAPNFLEFMDDKSIAHYRTNIAANWNVNIPTLSHRRLLMEMLSREEIDVQTIFCAVMRREIPFDWLIVCLYPKERELKPEPRMFSLMCFEMRLFFTVLESNIADQVFPYLPQQTMTKDRLSVSRMFMGLTKPSLDTEEIHLFLEIDLSRWNLRWRELTVHGVGSTLDDMFGSPGCFTFVHEFFRNCMIVVRVANLPPEGIEGEHPPESDLLWYDHLGGFEGIAQKLWSICTYSMIDLAISPFALSFILIGQADNQVLSVKAKKDPTLSRKAQLIALRDTLTLAVSKGCMKVNQIVKPEECLESTKVITYSKDIYVDGVYYPTALKFNSRLFPNSAQDFPSIRTNVGAIFSTALAGAEKSSSPIRGYYLACLHAANYLLSLLQGSGLYSTTLRPLVNTSNTTTVSEFIQFLLTLPSELGGYPVLSFIHFIYKGGSDPLSKSLSSIILLQRAGIRMYDRILSHLESSDLYNRSPQSLSLIKDPYSVPLRKPVTSVDGVTKETMSRLKQPAIMKNTAILELVNAESGSYSDKLVEALSSARPFNPLIMRDILECSVVGIVDTIGKMFVATRTLQNVARTYGGELIDMVFDLEIEGFLYLKNRFNNLPSSPWRSRSIFAQASMMRDRWKIDTFPAPEGITTHMPFDFCVDISSSNLDSEGIVAVLTSSHRDALSTRGPYDPYVGSRTTEKRSEHGYKIVGTDTTSEAFRKLQLILSQTGGDPALRDLIDLVGLSRSHTIISHISDLLPGVNGGNLCHRYATRAGYQESYNVGSPNFATHCLISSDNTGDLSGGVWDYPVMFQEYFLTALWTLQFLPEVGLDTVRSVSIKVSTEPMIPLPSVEITVDPTKEVPYLSFEGNPLAFLSKLDLRRISGYSQHHTIGTHGKLDHSTQLTSYDKRIISEGWFRHALRSHGMTRVASDISSSLMVTDSLDIAEVTGTGLRILCEAAANVISDEICLSIVRASISPALRRADKVMALNLAETLSSTFAHHIGHPLLNSDPLIRQARLYDGLAYYPGSSRPLHKLTALISNTALTKLTESQLSFYVRKTCLFSSEDEEGVFQVFLSTLTRILLYCHRSHGITWGEIRSIMGRFILPTMKSDQDEIHKVNALLAICATLRPWLETRNMYLASEFFKKIGDSSVIIGLNLSAKDAMRMTRPLPEELRRVPVKSMRTRVRISKLPDTRIVLLDTPTIRTPCGPVPNFTHRLSRLNTLASRMGRHCGKRLLFGCSSTAMWAQFGSVFHNRSVIVVGSGQGSAAAAAILTGCTHSFGLDLTEVLPLRPHRFINYKPPAISMQGSHHMYTQVKESYTTSGDWFEAEVADCICQTYDSGDSAFVIDIELGSKRHGLELVEPLMRNNTLGPVLIRVFWTDQEYNHYLTALNSCGGKAIGFNISEPATIRARIVLITRLPASLTYYYPPSMYCRANDPMIRLPTSTDSSKEILSEAIFNLLPVQDCDTTISILTQLIEYRRSLLGIYESRLSYDRWTLLMRAILGLWWSTRDPRKRLDLLMEWGPAELATFPVSPFEFDIRYTRTLETHLTGAVSRLCPRADRTYFNSI